MCGFHNDRRYADHLCWEDLEPFMPNVGRVIGKALRIMDRVASDAPKVRLDSAQRLLEAFADTTVPGAKRGRGIWTSRSGVRIPLFRQGFALVGVAGFEPAAPASRRQCSTRLSYTPPLRERRIAAAHRRRKAKAASRRTLASGSRAARLFATHGA